MALFFASFFFLIVTVGPRYFNFLNFGYSFEDLGVYTQTINFYREGYLSPFIASLGKTFFLARQQPFFLFFWPVSFLTTSATLFICLDELAILIVAWLCARFALRQTQNRYFSWAIFILVCFCWSTQESLHGAARTALYAQVPLVLFCAEFLGLRRPKPLAFWFLVLCFVDLHFAALASVFIPFLIMTGRTRWNLTRRMLSATPVAVIAALSVIALHLLHGELQFDSELFFQIQGGMIFSWLTLFLFLPLGCPPMIVVGPLLVSLKLSAGPHDPAILIGIGSLAAASGLQSLQLSEKKLQNIVAAALVISTAYSQWTSPDPMFKFWNLNRWKVSASSQALHEMIAKIPQESSVAASESLATVLANRRGLLTISAARQMSAMPDYVVLRNEPSPYDHSPLYVEADAKTELGARLLKRVK